MISHRHRVQLNKLRQDFAGNNYTIRKPDGRVALVEPQRPQEQDHGSLNVAQSFELFEGTRLVGANSETRGIVNGVFMTVGEVRDDDCHVTDELSNCSTLTFAAIARSACLAWAMTVDSSQSRNSIAR